MTRTQLPYCSAGPRPTLVSPFTMAIRAGRVMNCLRPNFRDIDFVIFPSTMINAIFFARYDSFD